MSSRFRSFESIFTTPYFQLEEAKGWELDDAPYYRITGADSIICVVLDQCDNFVLVKQHRPNLEIETLETPAGGMLPSETPSDAAKRELEEETSLVCDLLPIGSGFHTMMNRTNIAEHIFFGMFPREVASPIKEDQTTVVRVARRDFLMKVKSAQFSQLAALGAIFLASLELGVDVSRADLREIEGAFRLNPHVIWSRESGRCLTLP